MKAMLLILIVGCLACNQRSRQPGGTAQGHYKNRSGSPDTTDYSRYYASSDTVLVADLSDDTLKLAKQDLNNIVDSHPEFFQLFIDDPDFEYMNNHDRQFGSEVGQDEYYELYSFFLRQRNGMEKFEIQRKRLIDIYTHINSLYGQLQYGGTYFGHQSRRILGYAEYSIYLLPENGRNADKTYNIAKQKELYIKSLRQLIDDESKIDKEVLGDKKIKRVKELNTIVDELDDLITDLFYLRNAQQFNYKYYIYY